MAQTIDQVISELDDIIEWCRQNNSRMGYFPALYRKVTVEVQQGILQGRFEDGPRMERLDVLFANRYIDAFRAYRSGKPLTSSWDVSFASTRRRRLIVLQHLLLGMNAHINLDLGIAAAQTSPGDQLPRLRKDFNTINEILSSLVDEVQRELGQVWPGLRILLSFVRKTDDIIVDFSMRRARDAAWKVAEELAPISEAEQKGVIKKLDQKTEGLAKVVLSPGGFISFPALMAIRLTERGSVRQIIDLLNSTLGRQ
ncbi:MAG: DUF5995 family protein [Chloroflexota bacterium]